jgi:hypothetical protein
VVSARVGYTSGGALPARVPTLRARGPPRGGGTRRALAPRMQIQRTVSRTETYTTQETRSGTRSDGAGGTESYTYTEDVQRLRVVNDVVTEEVPDPVPPQEQLLLETEWAEEVEAEAETEPMTGEEAIAVLERDFDTFDTAARGGSTDGRVSDDDLRAVAENADGRFTEEQQQAAQVLVDSQAYRSFLDVGAGQGRVDGTIGRDDVDRAVERIASGDYMAQLLDTADGRGGRDGHIAAADVQAALADPAVPQEMKDALQLLLESSAGSEDLHDAVGALTADEIAAASALVNTPEYAALSDDERRLVADTFRDSGGDVAATAELRSAIEGADFKIGTPEARSAALSRVALLNSSELAALPTSDQDLIRDTLAAADPGDLAVVGDLLALLRNENFAGLSPGAQTAILSQARNHPDSRAIENLERMVDKDWFRDQDLADQQRSAKLVAHLSTHDVGDRDIIENTLDRLLSPTSNYTLRWEPIGASPGNVTLGNASGTTLRLNEDLVPADNNPVGGGLEASVIENTTAHEISHLVNGDRTNQTFEYLNEEYRAWYVGYEAENGHPPSNQESMDRWEYFLNPNGGYADYAHGTDTGLPFDLFDQPGALDKPEEAAQIFALLSELSGLTVDETNYLAVMADPTTWATNPADPAPDTVFPATDDLDN